MASRPRVDPTAYARERAAKIAQAKEKRERLAKERRDRDGAEAEPRNPPSSDPPPPTHHGASNSSPYKQPSSSSHPPRRRKQSAPQPSLLSSFFTGPVNPSGFEFDPASFEKKRQQSQPTSESDRPSTCIAVNPAQSECCVGSADHASYTFSTRNASPLRRLYSRTAGHADWVSACAYLCDNRILTGGMDGKVCLWRRGGSDCTDLFGEQGSVSVIRSLSDDSPVAASAGYDGSVVVWDCKSVSVVPTKIENRKKQLPPLTAFAHDPASLAAVTGSNNGLVSLWDLNAGTCTRAAAGKHGSQIQHVVRDCSSPSVFYTAGVDGKVGLWDTRGPLGSSTGNEIGATSSKTPLVGQNGPAPISGLCDVDSNAVVVSGGTAVALLDKRQGLAMIGSPMGGHQRPIASLIAAKGGGVCFSGAIDGMVIAHSLETLQPLYGMGANKKSSAFLETTDDRLIVTGDDGHALVYEFA